MYTKPNLQAMVDALVLTDARFPWVKPTAEEADVAETVRWINDKHQGGADDPDFPEAPICDQHWGFCLECGQLWPCESWVWAQHLAIQFVGRAQDRYAAHTKAALDRLDVAERERRESA